MIIVLTLITLICLGSLGFCLWALKRLNIYIGSLEDKINEQLDRIDNFEELLKESNIKQKKVIRKNLIPEDDE